MGQVRGFLDLFKSIIQILVAYMVVAVPLDLLLGMNQAMGGHNADIATMLDFVFYGVVPVLLIIGKLLYAFLNSTRDEDASTYSSSYRRW